MKVRLLIVDDSNFFTNRLRDLLSKEPKIEVVGSVRNGKEAVEKTLELKPDVVTMDYEMPIMDGISAVREIMEKCPTPVLMLSALTYDGAKLTLEALDAGAIDYLSKDFKNQNDPIDILTGKIISVANSNIKTKVATKQTNSIRANLRDTSKKVRASKPKANPRKFDIVAIGTSTGGPVALQKTLMGLPANFPAPILLVQHMPGTFTGAFAERLNNLCNIEVREAQDGDMLKPGLALLAPGGTQMVLDGRNKVKVMPSEPSINYKPSVDITFNSVAQFYKDKALGVILTGMGADGKEGCKELKKQGSVIWAQDEESSVIYGMPMAVAKAGVVDEVINLTDLTEKLISDVV